MNLLTYTEINYGLLVTMALLLIYLLPNKKLEQRLKKLFIILVVLSLLDGNLYALELYLSTLKTHVLLHLIVSYLCYVDKLAILLSLLLIFLRNTINTRGMQILGLPLVIGSLIEGTIFFSPVVYYYDELNGFHPGPIYNLPNVFPILYLVILVIYALKGVSGNKWETIMLLVMCAAILGTIIYEAFFFNGVYLRETTLGLSILAYYMYFRSQMHLDELEQKEEERLAAEQDILRKILKQMIFALSSAVDAKDKYTNGHSKRVAGYAQEIGRHLGKNHGEISDIYHAGLLHDIGKIGVPEDIINKPGKLNDDEFKKIQKHPIEGFLILSQIDDVPSLAQAARSHHERYDGKGYPDGLKGTEIPEIARIIAVADAYDAMTSNRSYRKVMPQEKVREEIEKGIGTQFDPHFAKIMLQMIDADVHYEMRQKD